MAPRLAGQGGGSNAPALDQQEVQVSKHPIILNPSDVVALAESIPAAECTAQHVRQPGRSHAQTVDILSPAGITTPAFLDMSTHGRAIAFNAVAALRLCHRCLCWTPAATRGG